VTTVNLEKTSNRGYQPGRPFVVRVLWLVVEALVFLNPVVTSYRLKAGLLRGFGADVGRNLIIKPNVHIKYPWHLRLGDNVWLGERSWIDNFVIVDIGSNTVVSQGAYLCTGNHDWSDSGMPLDVRPIVVGPGAWIGAFARVAPGVTVHPEAVVTLGAVLVEDAEPAGVYAGNPAQRKGTRKIT
jgi:putative colanic acid biosynthesis acetyltransferase WcaF